MSWGAAYTTAASRPWAAPSAGQPRQHGCHTAHQPPTRLLRQLRHALLHGGGGARVGSLVGLLDQDREPLRALLQRRLCDVAPPRLLVARHLGHHSLVGREALKLGAAARQVSRAPGCLPGWERTLQALSAPSQPPPASPAAPSSPVRRRAHASAEVCGTAWPAHRLHHCAHIHVAEHAAAVLEEQARLRGGLTRHAWWR